MGFDPSTIIRWRKRRFVVVDCDGMDTIIAQEYRKVGANVSQLAKHNRASNPAYNAEIGSDLRSRG
jgi:hypothetical protein